MNPSELETIRTVLLRFVQRCGADNTDAEDAVQEALARALENGTLDIEKKRTLSWLKTAAKHCWIDQRRHEQAIICCHLQENDLCESAVDDFSDKVVFACSVQYCLHCLNNDELTLLRLRLRGCGVGQIAETLRLSQPTVEKRLQRTRSHLRALLVDCGLESDLAGRDTKIRERR